MINKEATTVLYCIDNLFAFFFWQSRTSIASSHDLSAFCPVFANIIGPMHHNSPSHGFVINPFFKTSHFKRQAMFAIIRFPGNIKAKAALKRFRPVGKAPGILSTRILSVCHIRVHNRTAISYIQYIHSFIRRRLAEIAYGKICITFDDFPPHQTLISFVCIFKRTERQTFLFQLQNVV